MAKFNIDAVEAKTMHGLKVILLISASPEIPNLLT